MSKSMKRCARGLALALTLAAAGAAPAAHASPAAAQALFDEAKKLMADGKHAEACPKLEESQRLDPGIGTQFHLASCYEQIGRTASAWSIFLDVAGASKAAGQADREKVARQRAAALEPKLVRLAIAVPEGAPADLEVTRDGVPVGKAQWGTAVPVDPGKHEVTAKAPGKPAFRAAVDLATAGASETVTVDLAAAAAAAAPPAMAPRGEPLQREPPADAGPATKRKSTGLMVGGIVLTGVGVLGLGMGALIVGACSKPEDNPDCKENAVPAGYVIGGLGIAGMAAGIPMIVIGARRVPVQPKAAGAAPALLVGPTSVGLRWSL